MIALQILISILMTLLPGYVLLSLFRAKVSRPRAILYSVGLGILFNILVGVVANFVFEISQLYVILVWIALFIIAGMFAHMFGRVPTNFKEKFHKSDLLIPIVIYLVALGLQYQTALLSPNLIGSDIHLEYFHANETLVQSYWNPLYLGGTINTCLGITLLLPVYKLMTGMELVLVFKVICPMLFAVLPVALYLIYKPQFGLAVSLIATGFFVTMPMFTMDMVQLIRQQQSELFFVLVVLLMLDDVGWKNKLILGSVLAVGAVITHYGMAVGFVGYLIIGTILVAILIKFWRKRNRIEDATRPIMPRLVMVAIALVSMGVYFSYYSWVNYGKAVVVSEIPIIVVQNTMRVVNKPPLIPYVEPSGDITPDVDKLPDKIDIPEDEEEQEQPWYKKFQSLNPALKEPILQTAIGMDFYRASPLGKIWRILQYLVEFCLIVGALAFIIKPNRKIKMEYMAFVVGSVFVVLGMFVLMTHSYGMGVTRVWQITLLFMSPLFVIGAGTIGKWIFGWAVKNKIKLTIISSLVLFIPYFIFNSGIVFEMAKMQPRGFIDVPYSIALSSGRIDIASVFEKEDVEAVEWLEEYIRNTEDTEILWGDTHGARLLAQRFGWTMRGTDIVGELNIVGNVRSLRYMNIGDTGYVFLRKRNIDEDMLTFQAEYAGRLSYSFDDMPLADEIINGGEVLFDNGARVVLVK